MEPVIPIVCSLTDKELRERREKYHNRVAGSLIESEELDNGTRFRFRIGNSTLVDLAEIINLERDCCPFLSFSLAIDTGSNTVSLEMIGPGKTREIIRSLFNWN
jgi:hypothetical protein